MSVVRTNAAAALLGVSPNTLRSWERRFGWPAPRRTAGGHRQYDLNEVEALRQALAEVQDISSAIPLARERGEAPASPLRLRESFESFDEQACDRLLEESLALRSVERTVEELLLSTVEALEPGGCERGFAWRYATRWLAAAQRVAPPARRDEGVMIFDATAPGDADGLAVQALELFLRRAGLRTLTLAAGQDPSRVSHALRALRPGAVVLAGSGVSLDALGRLVYASRQIAGGVAVYDFRGAVPDTGASTVPRLGPGPLAATETLVEALSAGVAKISGDAGAGGSARPSGARLAAAR